MHYYFRAISGIKLQVKHKSRLTKSKTKVNLKQQLSERTPRIPNLTNVRLQVSYYTCSQTFTQFCHHLLTTENSVAPPLPLSHTHTYINTNFYRHPHTEFQYNEAWDCCLRSLGVSPQFLWASAGTVPPVPRNRPQLLSLQLFKSTSHIICC